MHKPQPVCQYMVFWKQSSYEFNVLEEIQFQNSYVFKNSTEQQTWPSDSHCIATTADVYGSAHSVNETSHFSLAVNPHILRHGDNYRSPTTHFSAVSSTSWHILFRKGFLTVAMMEPTQLFVAI